MLRLYAATSRQHKLHLIRRHCYESVERVEAHFNEQVDLIGCALQDVGRILLGEHATAATCVHFRSELDAVERRDDVYPIDRRLRDTHAIGRVEAGALGFDARLADVNCLFDGTTVQPQLNGIR